VDSESYKKRTEKINSKRKRESLENDASKKVKVEDTDETKMPILTSKKIPKKKKKREKKKAPKTLPIADKNDGDSNTSSLKDEPNIKRYFSTDDANTIMKSIEELEARYYLNKAPKKNNKQSLKTKLDEMKSTIQQLQTNTESLRMNIFFVGRPSQGKSTLINLISSASKDKSSPLRQEDNMKSVTKYITGIRKSKDKMFRIKKS